MKTLLLLRHAKSDWGDFDLKDFERPLAKRGQKDAPRMGAVLKNFGLVPDQIISSPAERARQTSQLVAKHCGYTGKIDWDTSFYGAGSEDLFNALHRLPPLVETALLVGHNPAMEETASELLSGRHADWDDEVSITIPTAGLLCLELHIVDWSVLEPGDAALRWYLIPRLVKAILQGK